MKSPSPITLKTTINGEEVVVSYYFEKGYPGTYYQPPEPDSIEITEILYKGVDVQNILHESQLDDLEMECFADTYEAFRDAAEAAAESEYESRREDGRI